MKTRNEFASGWPVVAGSFLGMAIGIAALPGPALGVVLRELTVEFGWTRTQIALGPSILLAVLAISSPLLGWIADRVAPAIITTISLLAFSACLFLLSRMGSDVRVFYALFALMGASASGAAGLVYARAISATFAERRGLALAIALTGNGVTGIILPLLLVPFAAQAGWRAVFSTLSVFVLLMTPVVGILLARSGRTTSSSVVPPSGQKFDGVPLRFALRTPVFWKLGLCFFLVVIAAQGLQFHFISYLADEGVPPSKIAVLASIAGATLVMGRLFTGYLMDRFFAPYVAAAMMLISSGCIAAMAHLGSPAAPLGAIAIGLAMGAEFDLVAYLTARYFGIRAYGRIYSLFYATVAFGASASKILYGIVVDITGSYSLGMYTGAALLLVSVILFTRLPRFDEAES